MLCNEPEGKCYELLSSLFSFSFGNLRFSHIQQAFCLTKDDECKQISFLYDYFCDVHPDLVQLSSRKIVTAEAAKMKSSQKIPHLD